MFSIFLFLLLEKNLVSLSCLGFLGIHVQWTVIKVVARTSPLHCCGDWILCFLPMPGFMLKTSYRWESLDKFQVLQISGFKTWILDKAETDAEKQDNCPFKNNVFLIIIIFYFSQESISIKVTRCSRWMFWALWCTEGRETTFTAMEVKPDSCVLRCKCSSLFK